MCAAIIERFHDAYEARVREAPKGHGMDYVYVYLICSKFIPTSINQNPCAHFLRPMDMIFHGWSMSLFQAWQQMATIEVVPENRTGS